VAGIGGSQSINQLKQLLGYLPKRRIRSIRGLFWLSLVPGFLDFASIAVVGRLSGALVGGRLSNIFPGIRFFGGGELEQSLWLAIIFIALIWLQSIVKITLRFVQEQIASDIWLDLSDRIFSGIIQQPYEYHLSNNLARLSSELLGNLECLLREIVTPILRGISNIVTIVILTVGIIYVGGITAVGLLFVMLVAYILMTALMTPTLRLASSQKVRTRDVFTQTFFEVFKSINDVKLAGVENYFSKRFKDATLMFKQADAQSIVLPEIPRMIIEPLGITAIFAIGVIPRLLSEDRSQILEILPFLAVLSVGALRLAKPLQDLFTAIAKLRGGLPELSLINRLLGLKVEQSFSSPFYVSSAGILPKRTVSLQQVSYRYPSSDRWVLSDITLSIPVGSRVAFVGPTGSGKSTAANLLLSLLKPQKGSLCLDGVDVISAQEIDAWHRCCSQVPQNIQLLDNSVLSNIAFGIDEDDIDMKCVWECLESAQLDEFVADLPYGLYTQIGENGIALSGGQRQRIALARAFYRRSKFLILDEATSALDNQTESDVIQALDLIGRRCTTVVIAHRLTTIQRCDRIFEFCDGRIVHQGGYHDLQEKSNTFKRFVQLQQSNI